jgi:CO/xanthine dehydrogenase Mo-binding subunit
VLAVLTHESLPRIANPPHLLPSLLGQAAPGMSFFPMQGEVVHYAGQPVALVVADSHERAQHAASLVRIEYERAPALTTIDDGRDHAYEAERLFGGLLPGRSERGDVDAALARADVRVDVALRMAANHHNPMEAPSTVAAWEDGRLTIHESTMGVRATQLTVAHLLGLRATWPSTSYRSTPTRPTSRVEFVDVRDDLVGPLGAKGVGEIGQVGAAAAIANAVFHATGRRIRELPMAPELVMDPPR